MTDQEALDKFEKENFYRKVSRKVKDALENPQHYRCQSMDMAEPMLKELEKEIVQCCSDHDSKGTVYIHLMHVCDIVSTTVIKNKIFVRYSEPDPLPNSYLWRYNRQSGIEFLWCLPSESIIEMILTHPQRDQKFDGHLVSICRKYRRNELRQTA